MRLQRSTGTTWSAIPATLALPEGGLGWWGDAEISCWSATGCEVFRVGYGDASGFFHEVLHRWDGTAITPISAPDDIRDLALHRADQLHGHVGRPEEPPAPVGRLDLDRRRPRHRPRRRIGDGYLR